MMLKVEGEIMSWSLLGIKGLNKGLYTHRAGVKPVSAQAADKSRERFLKTSREPRKRKVRWNNEVELSN